MALSSTNVQTLTDTLAKLFKDIEDNVMTGPAAFVNGLLSGGATYGIPAVTTRIVQFQDAAAELALLAPANSSTQLLANDLVANTTLSTYYRSLYTLLDALETATGGLATYLSTNSTTVALAFAELWNAYAGAAQLVGLRPATYQVETLTPSQVFPDIATDLARITIGGSATILSVLDGTKVAPQSLFYRVSTTGSGARTTTSALSVSYIPTDGASAVTTTVTPSTTAVLGTKYPLGFTGLQITSLSVNTSGDDADFVYTFSADPPRTVAY